MLFYYYFFINWNAWNIEWFAKSMVLRHSFFLPFTATFYIYRDFRGEFWNSKKFTSNFRVMQVYFTFLTIFLVSTHRPTMHFFFWKKKFRILYFEKYCTFPPISRKKLQNFAIVIFGKIAYRSLFLSFRNWFCLTHTVFFLILKTVFGR